jgi:methylmalonyl-CoA mutase
MTDFFKEFTDINNEQWLAQLQKDLKGKSAEGILQHHDPIEDLCFLAHVHHDENRWNNLTPGALPYLRSGKFTDNSWVLNNSINEECPKKTNKKALDLLMKGASGITLHLNNFSPEECQIAIENIGFAYITSTFLFGTKAQFEWLKKIRDQQDFQSVSYLFSGKHDFGRIEGGRNSLIDAAQVQKCGGNCAQEIAFALHDGHEKLFALLAEGLNIDDAVTQLKFRFGIGSNYFLEIVKYRVFRQLWAEVVRAYSPNHDCSALPYIEAESISLNKSLRDPYTNLLRLTTETLSAIMGGVDELTLHAFDARSNSKNKEKHQRLVNNIALILQEESYMHLVIDAAGGSYSLEQLSALLSEKTWSLFQHYAHEHFCKEIAKKAALRKQMLENKSLKKVGINHFMNELQYEGEWSEPEVYEVGTELILERDCNLTAV